MYIYIYISGVNVHWPSKWADPKQYQTAPVAGVATWRIPMLLGGTKTMGNPHEDPGCNQNTCKKNNLSRGVEVTTNNYMVYYFHIVLIEAAKF